LAFVTQGKEGAVLVEGVHVLGSVLSVLFGRSNCYRCRFHLDAGKSCILSVNVRSISIAPTASREPQRADTRWDDAGIDATSANVVPQTWKAADDVDNGLIRVSGMAM
jgi:hypothetical protein